MSPGCTLFLRTKREVRTIPTLQVRKLRQREVKEVDPSHQLGTDKARFKAHSLARVPGHAHYSKRLLGRVGAGSRGDIGVMFENPINELARTTWETFN